MQIYKEKKLWEPKGKKIKKKKKSNEKIKKKEIIPIEVMVCKPDGTLVENVNILMTIQCSYTDKEVDPKGISRFVNKTDVSEISLTSQHKPILHEFIPPRGGQYRFELTVTDSEGLESNSFLNFTVSGGGPQKYGLKKKKKFLGNFQFFSLVQVKTVPRDSLTLMLNKDVYSPGILPEDSQGEILIQSPFSPAEGLLTITACNGLVHSQRYENIIKKIKINKEIIFFFFLQ